jgi:hypothetical protein
MSQAKPQRILNVSLPPNFRQIRLELAREAGHPIGDSGIAYVLIGPLDPEGWLDLAMWKKHREACRVARFRPGKPDDLGHLVHRAGDHWAFHYDISGDHADEVGYHFSDEKFVPGEYVSITDGGPSHTYRVVSVVPL